MAVPVETPSAKTKAPSKLAHVVLRTNKLKEMIAFYEGFLGARVVYGNDFLAFMTYDDEHHRIALVAVPGTADKNPKTCGLEHIAFTFDTLPDLLLAYQQRKEQGILPVWPVNHGPTTSIYYKDPDGNMLETQVDNFDDPDDATGFMASEQFAENPIGTDFDPEDFIKRLAAGTSAKELQTRVEIGPRGVPDWA